MNSATFLKGDEAMHMPKFMKTYFLALHFPADRRWNVGMTRVFTWCAIAGFFLQAVALVIFLDQYGIAALAMLTICTMLVAVKLSDFGHSRAARIVRSIPTMICYAIILANTGGIHSPIFYWAGVLVLGSMFSFGTTMAIPITAALLLLASYFYLQTGETFLYFQYVTSLLFIFTLAYLFHRLSSYFIRMSEQRATTITTILDNVKFGFLLVAQDLTVLDGYSKSCRELLGEGFQVGNQFLEVINLHNHRHGALYRDFIDQAFLDELPTDLTIDQLPKFVQIGGKTIGLSSSLVRDKSRKVSKILFTLIDASDQQRAENEARQNKQLVRFLKDHDTFSDFIFYVKNSISTCFKNFDSNDLTALHRELHTLKGNSALFDMIDITQMIHELEDKESIVRDDIEMIQTEFKKYLDENYEILQVRYNYPKQETWSISQSQLNGFEELVPLIKDKALAQQLSYRLNDLRTKPARILLGALVEHSIRMAENFGKELKIELTGSEILMDPSIMKPIMKSLVHIVRNAIDHGLERPEERGDKPRVGTLTISFEENADTWLIALKDDGCGIQVQKVAERALEKGLISPIELAKMSKQEICLFILKDGISTSEQPNELSGRGIGLAAVLATIENAGGNMQIRTQAGQGTSFEISIPKFGRTNTLAKAI